MVPVVEELRRLVAFPTVSNRPLTELAAHLATRAEEAGFRVERFEPGEAGKCTVIASIGPAEGDGAGLVVSGHMDVVPTEGQPWSSDPFSLTERDGKLFGRGTADMKGFLAAVCLAVQRIPRDAFRRELVLVWTHDEEIGCLGSAQLAARWQGRPLPHACWIGEPTGLRVLRMHPGHVGAELEVVGQAAHSSRPDLGRNAIVAAAEVIGHAARLAAELAAAPVDDLPEMDRPVVAFNVATIEGGVALNVVPDRCRIQIGYRPLPGRDPHAPWEDLRGRVGDQVGGCPVHGRILRVTPSMLTPAGTPLEGLLRTHADDPALGAATFATDGGNLAKMGMQPLIFGPGAIEVAHKADEFVPAADLVRAVDIAEDVIRRSCC
ncbi:MAG: acetylornithine deacetylase [Myxococcales bacterium]|nr:acetylornithine deacetylase [Myxococcales bacterium]